MFGLFPIRSSSSVFINYHYCAVVFIVNFDRHHQSLSSPLVIVAAIRVHRQPSSLTTCHHVAAIFVKVHHPLSLPSTPVCRLSSTIIVVRHHHSCTSSSSIAAHQPSSLSAIVVEVHRQPSSLSVVIVASSKLFVVTVRHLLVSLYFVDIMKTSHRSVSFSAY